MTRLILICEFVGVVIGAIITVLLSLVVNYQNAALVGVGLGWSGFLGGMLVGGRLERGRWL